MKWLFCYIFVPLEFLPFLHEFQRFIFKPTAIKFFWACQVLVKCIEFFSSITPSSFIHIGTILSFSYRASVWSYFSGPTSCKSEIGRILGFFQICGCRLKRSFLWFLIVSIIRDCSSSNQWWCNSSKRHRGHIIMELGFGFDLFLLRGLPLKYTCFELDKTLWCTAT